MDFKSDGFPYNSYYYAERFEYMSGETVPALGMLHFIFENLEAKCENPVTFFIVMKFSILDSHQYFINLQIFGSLRLA